MGIRIDLTGHKYNRLTVIRAIRKDKGGQTVWRCRCDCGNITEAQGGHLRNGQIKSCGCYRSEYRSCKCREATGDKALHWKGGVKYLGGYKYIYAPSHPRATRAGYVKASRLVAESKMNRYLKPHEVVHHKNRNIEDDRPLNLTVFPNQAAHIKHHAAQRRG